jgi:hypothetical protein
MTDNQFLVKAYLLNQLELVIGDISKLVDLCEGFNFANKNLSYFGLNLKLQSLKVGYLETVSQYTRLRKISKC